MSDRANKNPTGPTAVSGQPAPGGGVETPQAARRPTLPELLRTDLGFIPVLFTLIVIVLYFYFATDGLFVSSRNLSNLVQQIVEIGTIGLGSILVLLLGEIDLSVASVAALCAVIMGVLSERIGFSAIPAIAVAILVGAFIGFVNGILIAVIRVPAFIVTLAGSIAYAGLVLNILAGQSTLIIHNGFIVSIAGNPTSYLSPVLGFGLPVLVLVLYIGGTLLYQFRRKQSGLRTTSPTTLAIQLGATTIIVLGTVLLFQSNLGVPNSTALLVGLILLFWLILTRTAFGRHIYAVGGNLEAARRAGINVIGIRIAVFTLCSTLAAVGGILQASRGHAVASQINPTLLLDAIAASVIGGVSLFGGRGSVWAIILGALIIGSLENGLDLRSQGSDIKQMIEGAVLIIAVTVDALVRRSQARTGR